MRDPDIAVKQSSGLNAGNPENLTLLFDYLVPINYNKDKIIKGKNVLSADNQQERSRTKLCLKISGFVDGEGSFHVGIQKSKNVKLGWQIVPEFHVSQSQDRQDVLEIIKKIFEAGYIKANHKTNPKDLTSVYVVRDRESLTKKVVPFFKKYTLLSGKQKDFLKFAEVIEMMNKNEHLKKKGLERILKIAFSMNRNGKYRKFKLNDIILSSKSSETIRRTILR